MVVTRDGEVVPLRRMFATKIVTQRARCRVHAHIEVYDLGGGEGTVGLTFAHMDWLMSEAYRALRAEAVQRGLWRPQQPNEVPDA